MSLNVFFIQLSQLPIVIIKTLKKRKFCFDFDINYVIINKVIIVKKIKITTEFITLGQLLKIADIVSSGGEAKILVKELEIKVDGEKENRRGRKLYPNTIIVIKGYDAYQIV